jgi:hypothetical protein
MIMGVSVSSSGDANPKTCADARVEKSLLHTNYCVLHGRTDSCRAVVNLRTKSIQIQSTTVFHTTHFLYQARSPGDRSPLDRSSNTHHLMIPRDRSPRDRSPGDRSPGDRSPQDRSPGDRSPLDRISNTHNLMIPRDRCPQDRSPGERCPRDRPRVRYRTSPSS